MQAPVAREGEALAADGSRRSPVRIRTMTHADIPQVMELEKLCFPNIPPHKHWWPGMLEAHVEHFPDGQWVAVDGPRVVGSCTNLRVPLAHALAPHTWRSITGDGWLRTHDPRGDALYGTEIMVHPDYRGRRVARRFYQHRQAYIRQHGLKAFVSGGRIPDYATHRDDMTPDEYVEAVVKGRLRDRVLTPQLRSGMRVVGILEDYLTDPMSGGYATLILWENPDTPVEP